MLSTMLLSVKIVLLIRIAGTVHLMVFFVINTFEDIKTRLTFIVASLEKFEFLFLATPHFLPIVLSIVRSIVFGISEYI